MTSVHQALSAEDAYDALGNQVREAATRMRELATNATPGDWKLWGMTAMADQDGSSDAMTATPVAQTYQQDGRRPRQYDAQHITAWHPATALVLAEWLDRIASGWGLGLTYHADEAAASRLARAFLREAPEVAEMGAGGS